MCKYACFMSACVCGVETKRDEPHHTPHWTLSDGIKCGCHPQITTHCPALSLAVPLQTQWTLTATALTLLAKPKADHHQSSLRLWLHPSTGWRWENYSVLVYTISWALAVLRPGSRRVENKAHLLVQTDLLKLFLVYPFCPPSLSSSFSPPVSA